jgi:hypothetical protein
MTLRKFDDLPSGTLRDHGARERVDRVWQRLEGELETAAPRARVTLWWVPAAAAIIFGAGVVVGSKWARPEAAPVAVAEKPVANDPVSTSPVPAAAREEPKPVESAVAQHRSTAPRPRSVEVIPPLSDEEPVVREIEPPLVPPGPPEWKQLADADDFEAARAAIARAGGFAAVLGTASPAQLMSLVDVARAAGEREVAVAALRRVVVDSPDSPEAPLAALTLGNMLEQAGDEAGAAEAFALYRTLSPAGDFAEDATAREVEAALARGNWELAAGLVYKYEKDFPNGRRRDEFRRELERLAAASDAGLEPELETAPTPVGAPAPKAP